MASRTNVSCYLDYVSILAGGKKAIWFCVVRCRACCYSSLFFLLADVCLLAMRTKCHIRLSTYYIDVWWWPSSHRRWTESSIFCVICATMWTFFSVIILISIFSGYLFVLFFFFIRSKCSNLSMASEPVFCGWPFSLSNKRPKTNETER